MISLDPYLGLNCLQSIETPLLQQSKGINSEKKL